MRVLITPEWYPDDDRPFFGNFCREQARAVGDVHDVVVLAWRADQSVRFPFRIDERREQGILTFRLRFGHTRLPKVDGLLKLAGCIVVLLRLRRRGWRPDVIHAHEYVAGAPALLLGRLLRVPVVVSEHYSGFALGLVPDAERRRARSVFERAAAVCPVSGDLARRLQQLAPAARVEAVPNVVDADVFRPARTETRGTNGSLRLVTVGALVDVKDHRRLIEAMPALLQRRAVTLDVVGDGPLLGELEELARSLGVDDSVRFLGRRAKDAVAEALRGSDVFVLPSRWENMPCALLEALACGLPAVASRVGGVPEVVDESNGVVFEAGSAQALADGVETVAARLDRYDREKIADAVRARYGYPAIGRRWSEVYGRAVAHG